MGKFLPTLKCRASFSNFSEGKGDDQLINTIMMNVFSEMQYDIAIKKERIKRLKEIPDDPNWCKPGRFTEYKNRHDDITTKMYLLRNMKIFMKPNILKECKERMLNDDKISSEYKDMFVEFFY